LRFPIPGSYFPRWTVKRDGFVAPDETLPLGQTVVAGAQHVVSMFGGTVLGPILMGFDPGAAILFSGLATLLFFIIVGGRLPSFLGSSFSFIAVVIAATGYAGTGQNANIPVALGGIMAAGAAYAAGGLLVMLVGFRWIETLMPPVVTGAIVASIGLNLAPVAIRDFNGGPFANAIGVLTIVAVCATATYAPGILKRLPILAGGGVAYGVYLVLANGLGFAQAIDFTNLANAPWFGFPAFSRPIFEPHAMMLIAPVAIVLIAENLGHVKAIGAMTGRNMDPLLGRAFFADGLATMLSAAGGGPGVTTYAENIGVMAVTRNTSTLIFVVAGLVATGLGLSPKFGAAIQTIPPPVMGGLSVVIFGLIAATAGRIWIENAVDFSRTRNLLTVGVTLVAGAGDLTIQAFGFSVGGIGTATIGSICLYQILRGGEPAQAPATIAPAAPNPTLAAPYAPAGEH
jgi:uracil-xanthine permease